MNKFRYRYLLSGIVLLLAKPCLAQEPVLGLEYDDASYVEAPKKAKLTRALEVLPAQVSLKMYAPYPQNQQQYGTCTAWSSAYCGRTMVDAIKNNLTNRDSITKYAYSPAFLFRLLRPGDNQCVGGSSLETAMQLLKSKGSIPYTQLSVPCVSVVTQSELALAQTARLKDYSRLFDIDAAVNIKVQAVKKSLSEKKPVVFGMMVPPSFMHPNSCWYPTELPSTSLPGHAMCVIGYDDNMYGGAFEVQNSWGSFWATGGYVWIRYQDFGRFARYAYEFIDLPTAQPDAPDLSGELKLVLEDGKEMPATLATVTPGLKVVPSDSDPNPFTIYRAAGAYSSGTNFRIYISNNQPAYVYAISCDLSNEVTRIFPYDDKTSAALVYKKNDVALPDEDHYIQFDEKPGKDFLCVLYTRNELDINSIIKELNGSAGDFYQKLNAVLGNKMVDPKAIKFESNRVAFTGNSTANKDVIALMMELEHK